jgi:hypothetical protein
MVGVGMSYPRDVAAHSALLEIWIAGFECTVGIVTNRNMRSLSLNGCVRYQTLSSGNGAQKLVYPERPTQRCADPVRIPSLARVKRE